jgi:hypothetical protein
MKQFFFEKKNLKTFIHKGTASLLLKRRRHSVRPARPLRLQVPKPLMGRQQRCHDRLTTLRPGRHAQQHKLQRLQQFRRHDEFAFVAGSAGGYNVPGRPALMWRWWRTYWVYRAMFPKDEIHNGIMAKKPATTKAN